MWSGIQKNVQKSSREVEIWPKIMFLDPKEVFKPKISLIEVVRRHKIDFGTKLQVVWSMYEVRNPKNIQKSSLEEKIWPKIMTLDPKEVSKPKISSFEASNIWNQSVILHKGCFQKCYTSLGHLGQYMQFLSQIVYIGLIQGQPSHQQCDSLRLQATGFTVFDKVGT